MDSRPNRSVRARLMGRAIGSLSRARILAQIRRRCVRPGRGAPGLQFALLRDLLALVLFLPVLLLPGARIDVAGGMMLPAAPIDEGGGQRDGNDDENPQQGHSCLLGESAGFYPTLPGLRD